MPKKRRAHKKRRGGSFGKALRVAGNYMKTAGIGKQVKKVRNALFGKAMGKIAGL
jgi:hypothetical protein